MAATGIVEVGDLYKEKMASNTGGKTTTSCVARALAAKAIIDQAVFPGLLRLKEGFDEHLDRSYS